MVNADLIVIGAGPGGYEIAAAEAAKGASVVLIERDLPGGTCLNRGCIPTKCLCASADAALSLAGLASLGVEITGEATLNYAAAATRMRSIVSGLRDDVTSLLAKCHLVSGEAAFTADGNVAVGDETYSAPRILIATGSRPASLPIPGAELCFTSDDFLRLDSLPESVVVIGGGVIGLEFASIMAAFGVSVTVIEYCKEILPPFDREIAKRLRTMLTRRGFRFIVGAAVSSVEKTEAGLAVTYSGKKGPETVGTKAVLMAVGRRPVTPDGLAGAGINVTPRGFIETGADMQTSRPGVYAVGDCNGRLMLAHAASAQARVALGENVDLGVIPSAVFTSPEAAMVGLTAEQCDADGIEYKSSKAMFAGNGKARAMGHAEGLVKVIYSPSTRRILGCHIVGPHASDLIAEIATAMVAGLTVDDVATRTIHGHPTLSEVVMAACIVPA